MYFLKIWITLVYVLLCVKSTPLSSRIINGVESTEPHPWIARIVTSDKNTPAGRAIETDCGGSLIAPKWILTAKHCLLDENNEELSENYEVSIGNNVWPLGQFIKVVDHFFYSTENHIDNDIALLLLERALDNIDPISIQLNDDIEYDNELATIYGWGRTDPKKNTLETRLRETKVKLNPSDKCDADVLCFDPNNTGTNACVGDSGGPMTLLVDGVETLVGVTHVGEVVNDVPCSGSFSSYTKTFYPNYAKWIKKTMSENE